ncbi:MAG: hypothetical protein IPG45_14995 [Deltaproteobacteria bacterium]|jgi:hypothetical protein|nr:hypothetical protein [Deltaproteobacteria bacterium]
MSGVDSSDLRTTHWDLRWSLEGGGISWADAQSGRVSDLKAQIERKFQDRSGGTRALERALQLLAQIDDRGLRQVLDADDLMPSHQAARAREGQAPRSFGANAGGGGVNFAVVQAKLNPPQEVAPTTIEAVLAAYPDGAVHRLSRCVPEEWKLDPELRAALELLIERFLLSCQKFGDGYAEKQFLARAEQLRRARGPTQR